MKNSVRLLMILTVVVVLSALCTMVAFAEGEGPSQPKVKLKTDTYYYTGKVIDPSVVITDSDTGEKLVKDVDYKLEPEGEDEDCKSIGPHEMLITYIGKYESCEVDGIAFDIYPKEPKITSLKAGKKSFTVKFKKVSGGVKYKVMYRTGKGKWKTKKTSSNNVTVKKLKSKKKYQVKVSAYKNVLNGMVTYSNNTKAKTVKVK